MPREEICRIAKRLVRGRAQMQALILALRRFRAGWRRCFVSTARSPRGSASIECSGVSIAPGLDPKRRGGSNR